MRKLFVAILLAVVAEKTTAQAATALWGHPPNDPIIGIIARVPSYGGMWVDAGGHLHSSVADPRDSIKLLEVLTEYVSDPRRSRLRLPGRDYGIVIERARYSYKRLTEWERKIENSAPALNSIGVDEKMNRLAIGVETVPAIQQTRTIVARLGIPLDAVAIRQEAIVVD